MNLSAQILISLLAGQLVGLFFGELTSPLKPVGEGFVLLLQMTVLPYVATSLITGLGSLQAEGAARLAIRAVGAILLLWAAAILTVLSFPLAFPDWESASFFSTNLIEWRESFDFLSLFIPANPFRALAEAVVPAVVVFSVAVGIALIGVEGKHSFMEMLETLKDALSRVTTFVVRLAPIGVFAIASDAAGTLSLDQARSLQVYMSVYAFSALVLAFWTLPGLVAALTPYT